MEILNPRLTIENTDQAYWLVRLQHRLSDGEYIDVQLKMPRSDMPLTELQPAVMQRTIETLQRVLDARTGRTPSAG